MYLYLCGNECAYSQNTTKGHLKGEDEALKKKGKKNNRTHYVRVEEKMLG